MNIPTAKTKDVKVPRWLYEQMLKDSELVRHLMHYKGYGWVNAAREEMESDKKFKLGAFK